MDNSSLEKPRRKISAADLDFIIIEQENIEISYIKSAQPNTKPPQQTYGPLLQILLIRSVGKDLCNVEDVCQSQCRSLLCLPVNSLQTLKKFSSFSLQKIASLLCIMHPSPSWYPFYSMRKWETLSPKGWRDKIDPHTPYEINGQD